MATAGGVEELLGKKRGEKRPEETRLLERGLREEVKERAALDRGSIEHRVLIRKEGSRRKWLLGMQYQRDRI